MLPPEVFKNAADFLSRHDLESLQLSNTLLSRLVERDFACLPWRMLDQLLVVGLDNYTIFKKDETVSCTSADELNTRLRLCVIDELSFDPTVTLDQQLYEALAPLKAKWGMGRCCTPRRFATSEIFRLALSELLICKVGARRQT